MTRSSRTSRRSPAKPPRLASAVAAVAVGVWSSCASPEPSAGADPWRAVVSGAREALRAGRWREALRLAAAVPRGSSRAKEAVSVRCMARRLAIQDGQGILASLEIAPARLRAEDEPEVHLLVHNLSEEPARLDLGGETSWWAGWGSREEDPPLLRLRIARTSWTGQGTRLRDRWESRFDLADLPDSASVVDLPPGATWRTRLVPRLDRGGAFLLQRFRLEARLTARHLTWGGDAIPLPVVETPPVELRFYPEGYGALEADPLESLRRALDRPEAWAHVFVATTLLAGDDVARGRDLLRSRASQNEEEEGGDPRAAAAIRAALDWLGVPRPRGEALGAWVRHALARPPAEEERRERTPGGGDRGGGSPPGEGEGGGGR